MNENARLLALLEAGEADHARVIAGIQASWRDEDHIRALERKAIWEQHQQGARDRDAVRVSLGGESLFDDVPTDAPEQAAPNGNDIVPSPVDASPESTPGASGGAATPDQPESRSAGEDETADPDAAAGDSGAAGEVKPT